MRRPDSGISDSDSDSDSDGDSDSPTETNLTSTSTAVGPGAMWWHMGLSQLWHRLALAAAVLLLIYSAAACIIRMWGVSYSRDVPNWQKSGSAAAADEAWPKQIYTGPADLTMSYGEYARPGMDGLTLMASLPAQYVPTKENGRRLVVVGDIHGMDDELARLLEHIKFNRESDHLVAAGDMVNKGPDSPGVVARLMALNASGVRGNHEDRVLLARAEADSLVGVGAELASPDAEAHRGEVEHLAVARRLSPEQVAWLSKLPVILTVDPLPIYIVHAGRVPGVRLEKQDPWAVMNMRTLRYPREELRNVDDAGTIVDAEEVDPNRDVAIPIEDHTGEKWPDAWNRQQTRVPTAKRRTVIYGHDSKRGFVEGMHTFGLDSGCVGGGALTAMIIEGTDGGGFRHTISQVTCKKAPRYP
ncbi:Bis(5'-nucleosyl)-tetraphosphatase, symmetrical [Tolypocladium ophioglossoides CBS 100239]|uniref:Bis(5'-nucleosyl)-tetraphosphatase, symmetrical n=1 Tax=Tolypocladium ophioglossoides (strain CBS 100239) TaxID=1163406 RepID=A0A0L0N705_TOLOC|nr:Bis(5'-nucleosyl)-tetraphosphatase, symmetrical [Tolypocladium ophioglossoides CBS 100239]